jgi:tRNA(fMet)-specific endonuclease VapC
MITTPRYMLETDHLSLIDRDTVEGRRISSRLSRSSAGSVSVCIISYEEQVRGWMAAIAQSRTVDRQLPYYREFERLPLFYCDMPLLPFDEAAADVFQRLRREGIRIGAMDLKIASIVLVNDAIVLTRNTVDFDKVPGLVTEDWSI